MLEPELFLLFVRPLNKAGIRYVVAGSVAATFYGVPRFTHDVDFVVFLGDQDIQKLIEAFPEKDFYVPPPEIMAAELGWNERGHFNLIHHETAFKGDFFPVGRDDLNAWSFRHKRIEQFKNEPMILAPPEAVIVSKLEYYREGKADKHLSDIRSILTMSDNQIDKSALNHWITKRGLEVGWRLASGS